MLWRFRRPFEGALHKLESGLGMFFGTALTLILAGLISFLMQETWSQGLALFPWALFAVVWVLLDLPYIIRLWYIAFRGPAPIIFETAARQRPAPSLLRPIIALWWLAHFAFGVLASLVTATVLPGEENALMNHFLALLLATSYGYAANGYLMNAICSLTQSRDTREAVWRRRGFIDVALGIAGFLLPASLFRSSYA